MTLRPAGLRRRWWFPLLLGLMQVGSEPTAGGQPGGGPPILAPDDPRLAPLRAAAAAWGARPGPERAVIDQVCLVPDLASFFEAIGRWDRAHFYPILIEDAESTLRFLRAFRPARVVRPARPARPPAPGQTWAAATAAVRQSWRPAARPVNPGGDVAAAACAAAPADPLGPTPPGVVLSSPAAPMLAGAVALSAGRFQPLVRFDAPGDQHRVLTPDEFHALDDGLTRAVVAAVPACRSLGDDCDFVTLAGPYPDRYRDVRGEVAAVDDAIARSAAGVRWAYAGRILGDPANSVYQAMCALFLQPESVAWFNGYDELLPPWSRYTTRGAAAQLAARWPGWSRQASHQVAGWADWHEAFAPSNRAGLVWINSHGSPTVFHLQGDEPASTADVPRTVPCAVVMIHSFSAADPTDPNTIAGRWLANGAFAYFGSINEPFLLAFRPPQLAGGLLSEGLPLVAALRATLAEPYGAPWRLTYLGDPLYRLAGPPARPGRVAPDDRGADGSPGAAIEPPPGFADGTTPPAPAVLRAGLDAALLLASSSPTAPDQAALIGRIGPLLDLNRAALDASDRRSLDAVVADYLFAQRRRAELRAWIEAIPAPERTPALARWLEAIDAADFAWVLAGTDFDRILQVWRRVNRAETPADFRAQAIARVAPRADTPGRRAAWAGALRAAPAFVPPDAGSAAVARELARIAAATRPDRAAPAP